MKCELPFEKFKQSVSLLERVTNRQGTLPVLSCIYMDFVKNGLTLRATNLDVGIEVELSAKIDGECKVAVPARTLSAFLSQINTKESIARLEVQDNNLNIYVAKSKGLVKTMPHDDFPLIPKVDSDKITEIPSDLIIKGLKSVWYSASVSNVKPELSSIYLFKESDKLVFASTDSFRLAEKKINAPQNFSFDEMLIPLKNSIEISKVLEYVGGTIKMRANKNLVAFGGQGVTITSRVIDGIFPDYRQIIPKTFSTEAVLLKQDLANSLRLSTVFSDSFNQIKIIIDPKSKKFQISTKNTEVGEQETLLDSAISGEVLEINFNHKYIADVFQAIDADSVSLQFNGKNKPLVIRPISGESDFLYLVMPMNR